MCLDDGTADRQSHAHTVRSRCVEWLEKPVQRFRPQPRTGIPAGNTHAVLRSLGADLQLSLALREAAHRLNGVGDQVQNHLLQLHSVALKTWQTRCELLVYRNAALEGFAVDQCSDLHDRVIDVQQLLPRRLLLCEVHQAIYDVTCTTAILDNALESAFCLPEVGRLQREPVQAGVRVHGEAGQRLPELMGNRGGEVSKDGNAVGACELPLDLAKLPLATRNVQRDCRLPGEIGDKLDFPVREGLQPPPCKADISDDVIVLQQRYGKLCPHSSQIDGGHDGGIAPDITFMLRYIGNVEGRFSGSESTQKGAWSRKRWWSCPLGGRARRKSLCDAAGPPFFGETQGRRIDPAKPRGAVEDGLQDGVKGV